MSDRYETAARAGRGPAARLARAPGASTIAAPAPAPSDAMARSATAERLLLKVVPKGLRSFDAEDAEFFLGLLPGPRDRDGLPESLRFWKTRIEADGPRAGRSASAWSTGRRAAASRRW